MKSLIIQFISKDQKGIIAQVTSILHKKDVNILSIEQHVDKKLKKFYMRILADLSSTKANQTILEEKLNSINKTLKGKFFFYNPNHKINVAILGTNESEPIYDLLIKNNSNELNCNIPIIISNHNKLKYIATQFNINYSKIDNNNTLLKILQKEKIDLIVLARYMQVIPRNIVNKYPNKIINIHHGFLPAFKGANPYQQAADKGVKIIGATAHYVTEDLDEGPIINQDVISINHMNSVSDMKQLGREVERRVLYKAVKAHIEHKVITFNNKTIVFK